MTANWTTIDRRLLIGMGALGVAGLAVPGAAQVLTARGFTHGVASGEPAADAVLLWTRYVGGDASTSLTVEVSDTPDFARVIGGGQTDATAERDHTARLTVTGLAAGRWYFYRFVAPDGSKSIVGRTRTLPQGRTERFNLAVFSCSNIGFGYFTAYADAAARGDIDLAVHLGDYFYEYQSGNYPSAGQRVRGADMLPAGEIVALADYRLRYASYRSDPALQRLHQVLPMIAQWDDHEVANDTWNGGAENHQPATEGDWGVRKAAAIRAYHDWMPVSDAPWRSYQIGDLATIALPETRTTARSQQLSYETLARGEGDLAARLTAFRDGPWSSPERQMMGLEQEAWLASLWRQSLRSGTRWQVQAQQVIMGTTVQPADAINWVPASAPAFIRSRLEFADAARRLGLPVNLDAWDGYPAARNRVLAAAQSAGANLVTLAGDSHNAWAFDLAHDNRPVGVEFAGQSVTSPGYETYLPVPPAQVATSIRTANPSLKWVDTSKRGYFTLELTRAAATARYRLWDSVRTPDAPQTGEHLLTVRHGRNRLDS